MKSALDMSLMLCLLWLTCFTVHARVITTNFTDVSAIEERNNSTQLLNPPNGDRTNMDDDQTPLNITRPQDVATEPDVKAEVFCGAILCGSGRECLHREGAPPECVCKKQCPDRLKVVCGSDGVTYDNHCFLHRSACLQKIKIHISSDGPCPGYFDEDPVPGTEQTNMIEDEDEDPKPLVCYQIERDQLRQLLIDWLKGKVEAAGWFSTGRSYFEVLTDSFRDCDRSGDDKLSAPEFMQCVERNDTSGLNSMEVEEQTMGEPGHVLRGLCVDALIVMSDRNSDWELDLEEFRNCLDPEVEPPKKQCSLEEKAYEDGAEVRVDCNICVCACGNWVCTATSCNGLEEDPFELYDIRQGDLPTKEERQRLLQGFIAAEHVNLERIEQQVPANQSHGYNDVPRPHGNHPGYHGHSHVGTDLTNEDQAVETTDGTAVDSDEYYYYYDGEIPDWAQEYYAEYEDELQEKIEEVKNEDEEFYEHNHEHNHGTGEEQDSLSESSDSTEESVDEIERQDVRHAEGTSTPTPPSQNQEDDTDFESEALIPTQGHHQRSTPAVTDPTITVRPRNHHNQNNHHKGHRNHNHEGHHEGHHQGHHQGHHEGHHQGHHEGHHQGGHYHGGHHHGDRQPGHHEGHQQGHQHAQQHGNQGSRDSNQSHKHSNQGHHQGHDQHDHQNHTHHGGHLQGENHTSHIRHSNIQPIQAIEDDSVEPERKVEDADEVLKKFFPQEIGITHLTGEETAEEDVHGDLKEHEENTENPEPTTATTTATSTRPAATEPATAATAINGKQHNRHRKNKMATSPTTVPTLVPSGTNREAVDKDGSDEIPPARVELAKVPLGGRVNITVQHLGTEVLPRGRSQEVDTQQDVIRRSQQQKHNRRKSERRRHNVNMENDDVTH